jgi:hypothetical protein
MTFDPLLDPKLQTEVDHERSGASDGVLATPALENDAGSCYIFDLIYGFI